MVEFGLAKASMLILCCLLCLFAAVLSQPTDSTALLAFARATGNSPLLSSWVPGTEPCDPTITPSWIGVTCKSGRVERLVLNRTILGERNYLQGTLPTGIGLLDQLYWLDLSGNFFTGGIQPALGNLSQLYHLDLRNSNFTGSIPAELGSMLSVHHIYLSGNNLFGPIPDTFQKLVNISELRLANCGLSGLVSDTLIASFPYLRNLELNGNAFSGPLPQVGWGALSRLQTVDLGSTALRGQVPGSFGQAAELRKLYIQNCPEVTGSIPRELGYLTKLEELLLDSNALAGPIPPDLGRLGPSLRYLSLSNNKLNGTLPWELANLVNLRTLNLANNTLTGPVPFQATNFTKVTYFDVATGNTVSSQLLDGSPAQCGTPTSPPCPRALAPPAAPPPPPAPTILPPLNTTQSLGLPPQSVPSLAPPPLEGSAGEGGASGAKIGVAIGAVVGVLLLGGATLLLVRRVLAKNLQGSGLAKLYTRSVNATSAALWGGGSPPKDTPHPPTRSETSFYTLSEIETITDGFNPAHMLDNRGHVYKGHLPDGTAVVVKPFGGEVGGWERDFLEDAEAVGRVHHPNLWRLRGVCSRGGDRLAVLEFVEGGSLADRLHGHSRAGGLSWPARLRVVTGVAKGLSHLLESCHPPIVHGHLDSSHVLLDRSDEPIVSNFGFARPRQVAAPGAVGYLAPECQYGAQSSPAADVYSFGALVVEIILGRQLISEVDGPLLPRARAMTNQQVLENLDVRMGTTAQASQVLAVWDLAMRCVNSEPHHRPSIGAVLGDLLSVGRSRSSRRLTTTSQAFAGGGLAVQGALPRAMERAYTVLEEVRFEEPR